MKRRFFIGAPVSSKPSARKRPQQKSQNLRLKIPCHKHCRISALTRCVSRKLLFDRPASTSKRLHPPASGGGVQGWMPLHVPTEC